MKKFSALLFMIFCPFLFAQDKITLAIDDWTPYLSKDLPNGGPITHLVVSAFKASGKDVEIFRTNWSRAEKMVARGQHSGSFPWAKSKKRMKHFAYGDKVLNTQNVFFHRKGIDFKWNNYDDLKKYKLVVTKSYAYSEELTKRLKDKSLKAKISLSDKGNLEKLENGSADIFPCSIDVCNQLIKDLGFKNITYSKTKPVSTEDYYLIVSKKDPNKDQILKLFSSGLKKLKASGEYDKIIKK